MPSSEKPRHRSGYTSEETEQVRAVCLTIAVTLGAYLDDLCIVGGLVPPLLIDTARTGSDEDDDLHPGTNDLDVGLALVDDKRYAEISRRLRAEDFEPDTNDNGNETVQCWRLGDLKVTIDFLIPPTDEQDPTRRIQNLEPDFGAVITPGLELAFEERVLVEIDGHPSRESTRDASSRFAAPLVSSSSRRLPWATVASPRTLTTSSTSYATLPNAPPRSLTA